eukprot:GHVU01173461.1.p1 GENE.GHVU01173461.1~~GHVU01173461.1.p1  ORF type:complete len:235 (+),score=28.68 GHVU01173461.1:67-771(+)
MMIMTIAGLSKLFHSKACMFFLMALVGVLLGDDHAASASAAASKPSLRSTSQPKPRQEQSDTVLEKATLYGGMKDYAYYFVDILVGNPPQRQSVILDSGSSLLGFPCKGCTHCGNHIDAPFNFSASTTARWLDCHDKECFSGCGTENHCRYSQGYSEGSSIAGHYFIDSVALGDFPRHNKPVEYKHIGCHNRETKLFTTQVLTRLDFPNCLLPIAPIRLRVHARVYACACRRYL